jgi:GTP pyrophosphokinase
MNLDAATIEAALLHDTLEDTNVSYEKISSIFGSDVAQIVAGVSKTGKVQLKGRAYKASSHESELQKRQIENLKKMFLVMSSDLRVVLIRLFDRLHNMQTLWALPKAKQRRIAKETMEIYAPLANRLGMGELKGQLEDLSFPYVYPKKFKVVKSRVGEKIDERQRYIEKVKKFINAELAKENIRAEIHGRAKHLYSLYKKLVKYQWDFNKVYDLIALRIIVSDTETCYKVLGLIHKNFKPLLGRIKDYIALPKPNGYQSLHTTVFCLDGKITEFQIRTYQMHDQAENGIAAHWHYDEQKLSRKAPDERLPWITDLVELSRSGEDKEFYDALKIDVFSNRIYVLTPQGEVVNLPEGSTPIDFAYAIHSDVGNAYMGAKINGRIVNLSYKLKNGEIVEIIKSKNPVGPKHDWLNFTKTEKARGRIRAWFRGENPKS